jgi:hypothetical protein
MSGAVMRSLSARVPGTAVRVAASKRWQQSAGRTRGVAPACRRCTARAPAQQPELTTRWSGRQKYCGRADTRDGISSTRAMAKRANIDLQYGRDWAMVQRSRAGSVRRTLS